MPKPWGFKTKRNEFPRKEWRVILLVTKDELNAIDAVAKKQYLGNRSMVIREALVDFGLLKKSR